MQTHLIEHIELFYPLSDGEKEMIRNHTFTKKYSQGEYFLEAGKIANQIAFVVSGVFRFFFYDKEGAELTTVFLKEEDFVTNLTSFFEYVPCSGSIQAETPCEVVVIERASWDLFNESIPAWSKALNLIREKFLIDKINFQRSLIHQEATEAYQLFVQKYPTVMQRVPLTHIASFLGITPYSLSRIRKQLAER